MAQPQSAAEASFAALSDDQRASMLRAVFVALEYNEDYLPGVAWSPDTLSRIAEVFSTSGVEFTPPDV